MGKSSPSGSTTQTSTQTPFASGYYYNGKVNDPSTLYGRAYTINKQTLQFPDFQTYAGPTAQQNQAIGEQTALANNDPTMQAATGGIQPYLNGSMLSAGNPYLQGAFNSAAQTAIPGIQSGFEANGRYGSGAMANAQASALTNLAGNMAYQNYNDQSTNQLKAELLAPQISGGNFNDIAQLSSAGAQQQAFNQLPITQQLQQFQFNQDAPYIQAQRMQSLLTGGGGTGTSTSPYFTNPVGSALGAASALFGGGGLNGQGPSLYQQMGGGSLNNGVGSLWNSLFGMGGSSLDPSSLSTLSATSPGDL